MKLWMCTLLAAGWAFCAGAANLFPINSSFESWKGNSPAGFNVNTVFKNWKMEKRSGGAYQGENCLHVETAEDRRSGFALMAGSAAAQCGDKVKISCFVRGKGKMRFEIYCYNAGGHWVGKNVESPFRTIDSDQWLEVSFDGVLPPASELKRGPIGKVRAVLYVAAASSLDFDNFSGSAGAAAAPETVKQTPPAAPKVAPATVKQYPVAAIEPRAAVGPVYLPPRLYAVPGQELNIYFDNLAIQKIPGEAEVISSVGRHLQGRFHFVPKADEVGTHPLRLEWRDAAGTLLASAETEIVVSPAKIPPRKLRLLIVGDSLTAGGTYARRIGEVLRQDGLDVHFIGSHSIGGKPAGPDGVVHEGYGGWQFSTFLTRWTDGADFRARSPFLTGPGKLDIPAYFAKHGGAPDVITVLLGINDIAGAKRANLQERLEIVGKNADALLEALAKAAPNAKIGVGLIPPPSASQDAFGYNYRNWISRAQYCRNVFAFWQMMEKKYRNHSRYELVPVCVNIDCKNNYPTRKEPLNAHNSTTRDMACNAVHPATAGYRQIGDSFYFWIRSTLR